MSATIKIGVADIECRIRECRHANGLLHELIARDNSMHGFDLLTDLVKTLEDTTNAFAVLASLIASIQKEQDVQIAWGALGHLRDLAWKLMRTLREDPWILWPLLEQGTAGLKVRQRKLARAIEASQNPCEDRHISDPWVDPVYKIGRWFERFTWDIEDMVRDERRGERNRRLEHAFSLLTASKLVRLGQIYPPDDYLRSRPHPGFGRELHSGELGEKFKRWSEFLN